VLADPVGVKPSAGTSALAAASLSGLVAFGLFLAGCVVLWTSSAVLLGWSMLGLGLAAVAATAMLTLAGTRPDAR
jgi:hypothetical protein